MINKDSINYNKSINIPDHLISCIDCQFISKRHDVFFLSKQCSIYTENNYIIMDNDNKELYNCSISKYGMTVYDRSNSPVIQTKTSDYKHYIYLGGTDNEILTTIKPSLDGTYINAFEYEIEFKNQITDSTEILTAIYNIDNSQYSIYSNKNWKNETLICTFGRDYSSENPFFFIEVSPWIDYMQMIGVCICLHF